MSATDDPPPLADLEARARWHLGAFASEDTLEPDDREFVDIDGELCPDCGQIWEVCGCHVADVRALAQWQPVAFVLEGRQRGMRF